MEENARKLSQIMHSWDDVQFGLIAIIIVSATLLVFTIKRLLPWVPILRLAVLIGATIQIIPLLIKPTAENLFALLGATAIALGFAFKDYASSIIAGVVVLFLGVLLSNAA